MGRTSSDHENSFSKVQTPRPIARFHRTALTARDRFKIYRIRVGNTSNEMSKLVIRPQLWDSMPPPTIRIDHTPDIPPRKFLVSINSPCCVQNWNHLKSQTTNPKPDVFQEIPNPGLFPFHNSQHEKHPSTLNKICLKRLLRKNISANYNNRDIFFNLWSHRLVIMFLIWHYRPGNTHAIQ